jgi:hypothetical protein
MARSFRLTSPEPLELDIHEACAQALDKLLLPPAMWCCYPAGAVKLTPAETARLARCGLKRGWPDLLFVMAGLVFSIELKRARTGRLSKTRVVHTRRGSPRVLEGQEEVFERLRQAGMTIAICHSVEEVLSQLRRWGFPMRGRIG